MEEDTIGQSVSEKAAAKNASVRCRAESQDGKGRDALKAGAALRAAPGSARRRADAGALLAGFGLLGRCHDSQTARPSCVRPACPMRALYAFEVEIARVGCPVLHLGIAGIASPGLQVSAKDCMIFLTEWRQLFHRSCFHAS